MELGVYTFADLAPDPQTGAVARPRELLRHLVAHGLGVDEAPAVAAQFKDLGVG